ncbi:MAG: N-acetylmuramoyl-L-alanine amidase [Clostridium sp.]|uniref:peptidoglycan recognition protein family protein n=1 Tax=Clostridium sp. TaxID=1506 RepID=UPI0039E7FDA0
MLPIQIKHIKYNYSTNTDKKIYIVIHDTGNRGTGANAQAHFNYFNGGDRQASANYFVDDSNIMELVDPNLTAWHCGDGAGKYGITNRNSIGIEICINSDGNYDKAVSNALELTKNLMARYGIDTNHVVRHYDASRKNCPQSMNYNNWAGWTAFKARLGGATVTSSNNTGGGTTTVDNTVLTIQKQLNAMNGAGLVEDGISGANTIQAIKNFQAKYGLTVDGIWGQQSAGKMNQLYTEADARAKAEQARKEAEAKAKAVAEEQARIEAQKKAQEAQQQAQEIYRVRKSWNDAESQLGAYTDLQNAKDIADQNPDYIVYNSKGEMVYRKAVTKTVEQRLAELEARVAKLEGK